MDDPFLYPWSAQEVRCRDELSLWRASHQANIACKKAIEEALREHFDGTYLDGDCLSGVLEQFGYERTAWVLANTVQQQEWDGRFSPQNKAWAREVGIPQDAQHAIDLIVAGHPAMLDGLVTQYRQAYQAQLEPRPGMTMG